MNDDISSYYISLNMSHSMRWWGIRYKTDTFEVSSVPSMVKCLLLALRKGKLLRHEYVIKVRLC